jgi:hypothetical protein
MIHLGSNRNVSCSPRSPNGSGDSEDLGVVQGMPSSMDRRTGRFGQIKKRNGQGRRGGRPNFVMPHSHGHRRHRDGARLYDGGLVTPVLICVKEAGRGRSGRPGDFMGLGVHRGRMG